MAFYDSIKDCQWVIDPRTRIYCDGWESTAHSLIQNGWHMEKMYEPQYLATKFLMRNPSKNMVAHCMFEEGYFEQHPSLYSNPSILYFNNEALLIKAEMYQEMRIPTGRVQGVSVGEPIGPPEMFKGLKENDDNMWRMYTPKGEQEASEIIVTPEKIPFLLDAIREAQEPIAKENILNQRKRSELRTEAKILSFA